MPVSPPSKSVLDGLGSGGSGALGRATLAEDVLAGAPLVVAPDALPAAPASVPLTLPNTPPIEAPIPLPFAAPVAVAPVRIAASTMVCASSAPADSPRTTQRTSIRITSL